MAYCTKCGNKNENSAEFCSKCGAPLTGSVKDFEKYKEDQCEETCVAGKRNPLSPYFWGIIVILFGLWIIFQFVIPESQLPEWARDFDFWWLIGLIIAIGVIITGIRIILKK